jgi:hypothetical protein
MNTATVASVPHQPVAVVSRGLTIRECAAALRLSPKQVKYAVANGAPVIRRGTKGRGQPTLVDQVAIAAWLKERGRSTQDDQWRRARRLTQSAAEVFYDQFRREFGPHKRAVAVSLIQSFMAIAAVIRTDCGLPLLEPEELPECIKQLAKVVAIYAE